MTPSTHTSTFVTSIFFPGNLGKPVAFLFLSLHSFLSLVTSWVGTVENHGKKW